MEIIANLVNKQYLGYGVYVGWNVTTGEYVMYVEREDGIHWIAMTKDEIEALNRYADTSR